MDWVQVRFRFAAVILEWVIIENESAASLMKFGTRHRDPLVSLGQMSGGVMVPCSCSGRDEDLEDLLDGGQVLLWIRLGGGIKIASFGSLDV